ncbi:MAG: dimethylarginine dimethylaminohydrolase family protein [Alphaproteobacteria bacterium]
MVFAQAIVRTPCRRLTDGLTTAGLGPPDYRRALAQHADYIATIERCGVAVSVLPPLDDFPDSTFVEDVAVCTPRCAVITRPGAPSRRDETAHIGDALAARYERIATIEAPGTLEGGDVLAVGDHYYIGVTERTNEEGARQLIAILERHGMSGSTVAVADALHLKTGLAYLEGGALLVAAGFAAPDGLGDCRVIGIDADEAYAANSVWINDRVLMPAGFPKAREAVEQAGYEVETVEASEFRKLDGGMSCLSLRLPLP